MFCVERKGSANVRLVLLFVGNRILREIGCISEQGVRLSVSWEKLCVKFFI